MSERTTHALCEGNEDLGNERKRRRIRIDIKHAQQAMKPSADLTVPRAARLVTPEWVDDCVEAGKYLDPTVNGRRHSWL